jgi:anti-anti-sigma factor
MFAIWTRLRYLERTTRGTFAPLRRYLTQEARETSTARFTDFSHLRREGPLMSHPQPLRISETRTWRDRTEIHLEGEFDRAVAARLCPYLERAVESGANVLVNLEGCQLIDAAVLALLVDAEARIAQRNRRLLLHGAVGQPRRLLAICSQDGERSIFTQRRADDCADASAPQPRGTRDELGSADGLSKIPFGRSNDVLRAVSSQ